MNNLPKYIDLAFCLIVLPLMVLIFPMERWFHSFRWFVVTVAVWLYLLYFINRAFTVPLLFKNSKSRWIGIGLILLSFLVTLALSRVSLYNPEPNIHDIGIHRYFPSVLQYRQAVWSLFMIVEAFSFAIGLLTQTNLQRLRSKAMEAERDKAELELYKAQIKPHFMFNTLNSLFGLFLTHDPKALESLERFITIVRYIHTASLRDFIPLSEEVDYIRQYVALQSLRLNEATTVTLKTEIADSFIQLPPMLLVTFVENCFKHGVSSVVKSEISVSIVEADGRLTFETKNNIFPTQRIGEHMGIENCRRRLGLLYPERHRLDISANGNKFKVKLTIDL